jgi:hypothetical protein
VDSYSILKIEVIYSSETTGFSELHGFINQKKLLFTVKKYAWPLY